MRRHLIPCQQKQGLDNASVANAIRLTGQTTPRRPAREISSLPEWGGHSALPRNSTAAPQTGWRRDGDGRHISARHTRTAPVRQGEGDAFGARSEEISRIWSRPLTFWDALLGNLTSGSQESLLFPWIPVLNPSSFCKPAFQTDAYLHRALSACQVALPCSTT